MVRSNASSYHNEAHSESMTKKATPMKTKKEKTDSGSDSDSGSEDEGGMKKKKRKKDGPWGDNDSDGKQTRSTRRQLAASEQ